MSAPNCCRETMSLSRKEQIEEKVWEMMTPILQKNGLIGVDAEYVKEGGEYFLRCYIDKEGGVGITDCENVSRELDPLLDEADLIPDAYTLEVSSPGLGRVLKRPRDFQYGIGREVELRFYKARDGHKDLRGILVGEDPKTVTVESDGETKVFEKSELSKISLTYSL